MNEFLSVLISVVLFFVAAILWGRRYKNATLDKLELLPGEKILFDDECGKVMAQAGPKPALWPKSIVRLTNYRMIIAQHALFKPEYMPIRYVINHNENAKLPAGYGGGALKVGYITFATKPELIKIAADKEKQYIEINPDTKPGAMTGIPFYVRIFTDRPNDYMKMITWK